MADNKELVHLAARLEKEVLEFSDPSPDSCITLLKDLEKEIAKSTRTEPQKVDTTMFKNLEKSLSRARRSFQRHKRSMNTTSSRGDQQWNDAVQLTRKILRDLNNAKTALRTKSTQAKAKQLHKSIPPSSEPTPPRTVSEYRARLISQKKGMYKDPPAMPPPGGDDSIVIESSKYGLPKRDKKTGCLSFTAQDDNVKQMLREFHPNRTPEEVLRAGAFGGTYFRPITSAVTNISYKSGDVLQDTLAKEWMDGLSNKFLTSKTYQEHVNKFGVKCGGSLGMWESSGWIAACDPYGWFQWYCRFYAGRRCSDDARQISRWLKSVGPKGRFRSQLCNKILAANTTFDDNSVSPVIRQTLLHWGVEMTQDILTKHRKRVGK